MAICIDRSVTICGRSRNRKTTERTRTTLVNSFDELHFVKRSFKPKSFAIKLTPSSKFVLELNSLSIIKQDLKNLQSTGRERLAMLTETDLNKFFSISFLNNNSVDIVVVVIALILTVLNFHHIIFLGLTNRIENDSTDDYKSVYFNSSSLNDTMYNFLDEYIDKDVEIKQKCFAKGGSIYETFLLTAWFWLDLSAYSLIPACTMIVCTFIIVFRMIKINESYSRLIRDQNYQFNKKNYLKKIRKNRQIMVMLMNSKLVEL